MTTGLGPSHHTVNEFLDLTFITRPIWLQLHTGAPGTNGASNIADTDGRQLALFIRPADGVVQTTGAPARFVIATDAVDAEITHGSLHTELEGGIWRWNLIARSPIRVVGGDELILGDGMEFRVEGWTS